MRGGSSAHIQKLTEIARSEACSTDLGRQAWEAGQNPDCHVGDLSPDRSRGATADSTYLAATRALRVSFLALVEAFASLLQCQKKKDFGKYLWYYFANLDGHNSGISCSETDDAEQSYEVVLRLLAMQKEQLQSEEDWKYPAQSDSVY